MWRWRRTEQISWTDRVKNEEVLQRVKVDRNILRTIKRRTDNRIYHIRVLRTKSLPHDSTEGQVEGTRRGERRRTKVPDNLKGKKGCWNLTEETISSTERFKVTIKTQNQCVNIISILFRQHVSVLLDHLQASIQRYVVQSVNIMICTDCTSYLWMLDWRWSNNTETCCQNKILVIFIHCCVVTAT